MLCQLLFGQQIEYFILVDVQLLSAPRQLLLRFNLIVIILLYKKL